MHLLQQFSHSKSVYNLNSRLFSRFILIWVTNLFVIGICVVSLSACSDTESELEKLVAEKWVQHYGKHIKVESVKLVDMTELSVLGREIIEAETVSIIEVITPTSNCLNISNSSICTERSTPPGRYTQKSKNTFEKWKKGWRIVN